MTRRNKLVEKLLNNPKTLTYNELVSLLSSFGYAELKRGKTAGSRRAYFNKDTKHLIRLHKPHKKEVLKHYQTQYIIEELRKNGLL
jgi:hypothetical protein